MKIKEKNDLRKKEVLELYKLLADKKLEMEKASIDLSVKKEKNLKKVKNIKRDIAQISSIIHEMELAKTEVLEEAKK